MIELPFFFKTLKRIRKFFQLFRRIFLPYHYRAHSIQKTFIRHQLQYATADRILFLCSTILQSLGNVLSGRPRHSHRQSH